MPEDEPDEAELEEAEVGVLGQGNQKALEILQKQFIKQEKTLDIKNLSLYDLDFMIGQQSKILVEVRVQNNLLKDIAIL